MTGASRGIGAAIARGLAGDGWPVGVNYRADRDGAEAVVAEIERDGGRAVALAGDVADPGAPRSCSASSSRNSTVPSSCSSTMPGSVATT